MITRLAQGLDTERPDFDIEQWFDFGGKPLRAFVATNNVVWYVIADIAAGSGYRDASRISRSLRSDEKGAHIVATDGGPQELAIMSEYGLYRWLATVRKESAKPYQDWLFRVVVPTLRRTREYRHASVTGAPQSMPPVVTTPVSWDIDLSTADETMLVVFQELANKLSQTAGLVLTERRKVAQLEHVVEEQERAIEGLRGQALVAELLGAASGLMLATQCAKRFAALGLRTGPNRILGQMLELGDWIFEDEEWHNGRNYLVRHVYQPRIEAGLADTKAQTRDDGNGGRKWAPPSVVLSADGACALFADLWAKQFPNVELTLENVNAARPSNRRPRRTTRARAQARAILGTDNQRALPPAK